MSPASKTEAPSRAKIATPPRVEFVPGQYVAVPTYPHGEVRGMLRAVDVVYRQTHYRGLVVVTDTGECWTFIAERARHVNR